MDKKDLFDALDQFSQELLVTLAEVEAIKKHLKEVIGENTKLRLENEKLRERLGEVVEKPQVHKNHQGRDNLEKIYMDGFHICVTFYGQRRENDEECMFCDELLFR
ncbi:DNA replication initiation control protein YabA [Streptococcus sp. DD10]|uniref:DNA replication initiation control protein YabA n=1 Tax=Streptococcus sp. DD10 TaxID=1777878 RepID=UPI000794D662|nr:DNA replication initiation control protein YabA [Streptococcus sp. DD10]KXT77425.1 DNA replication initiation control protein YabA [Streptococcus sp. DD10]